MRGFLTDYKIIRKNCIRIFSKRADEQYVQRWEQKHVIQNCTLPFLDVKADFTSMFLSNLHMSKLYINPE